MGRARVHVARGAARPTRALPAAKLAEYHGVPVRVSRQAPAGARARRRARDGEGPARRLPARAPARRDHACSTSSRRSTATSRRSAAPRSAAAGPTAMPAREYTKPCGIHAAFDRADEAWRAELRRDDDRRPRSWACCSDAPPRRAREGRPLARRVTRSAIGLRSSASGRRGGRLPWLALLRRAFSLRFLVFLLIERCSASLIGSLRPDGEPRSRRLHRCGREPPVQRAHRPRRRRASTKRRSASRPFPTSGSTRLAEMSKSKKVVAAGFELVHLALPPGVEAGRGPRRQGARHAAQLRRDPHRAARVRRRRRSRPIPRAISTRSSSSSCWPTSTSVEQRLNRQRRAAKSGDKEIVAEVAALEQAHAALSDGTPLRRGSLAADDLARLAPVFLLTTKPMLSSPTPARSVDDRRRRCPPARSRSRSTSKPRSRRARPTTAPRCARCTASASRRSTPSRTPRTTCSAGARSSRPARTSRARGRSAPAPRRPSARA